MAIPTTTSRDNTTIITTTWDHRVKEWTDNIFRDRIILSEMEKRKKNIDGGNRLEIPVRYKKSTTGKFLQSDMEILTPEEKEFGTFAIYEWVQYAESLAISEASKHKNSGAARVFDYVNDSIDNILESVEEDHEKALWKSSPSSYEPGSIPSFIGTAGTGTVGTIVSGTETWWKNAFKSSVGSFAANGRQALTEVYNDCCKGMNSKKPDFIVTDQTGFENCEYYLAARERLTPSADQDQGFGYEFIRFKNAKIIWDFFADSANGGPIASASDGRFYFLNMKMMGLYVLDGQWMKKGSWLEAYDQMAEGCKVYSMYTTGVRGRRHLGVASGVTYP